MIHNSADDAARDNRYPVAAFLYLLFIGFLRETMYDLI